MRSRRFLILTLLLCLPSGGARSEKAQPLSALAKMPVKEITVFKDGHAFLLHEGKLPVDSAGNVQMDYLPTPVIGTFWPYSADKNVKLVSVVSSPRKVLVERTALTLRDLLEANPGTQVTIQEVSGAGYNAAIVGVPQRTSEEIEAVSPPNSGERLPEKGGVILLKTDEGVSVVALDRIQKATFHGNFTGKERDEEFRNLLTLKLEWPNNRPAKTADVGMMYLQKGIRWIPQYKTVIDGKGNAVIRLQATLVNEMTDLQDVTANLVVGVPTFAFKDMPDPIALQQTFAQLSQYFQTDSQSAYAFSNGIMGQAAGRATERMGGGGFGPGAAQGPGPMDMGPEIGGSAKNEDLFVFTVKHITLKKGQRMVVPVSEFPLKYIDIFTVDIPFAPPQEARGYININNEQMQELARLMTAPKAIHKIRLTNSSKAPLTTAPALILNGDRVIAQGMMTYTAIGAETDLTLTTATDVKVNRTEKETLRTQNAVNWQGNVLARVDMTGTVSLTNYSKEAINVEATRYVVGSVGKADQGGVATMLNVFEDYNTASGGATPSWANWYYWPDWWRQFNGLGRFTWKLKIPPQKTTDLGYTWHYMTR